MRSASPSRKTYTIQANSLLVVLFLLVGCNCLSGCALLSIPSYRIEQCSQGGSSQASPDFANSPMCEAGECASSQCEPELCEDYVPVFPTIPTPKCLQRWKEQRNLPEGPRGLKFHPLPTRPMFTPRPAAQTIEVAGMHGGLETGNPAYGAIPQGAQWIESSVPSVPSGSSGPSGSTNPNRSTNPSEPANAAGIKLPELKTPQLAPEISKPSESNTEELPAPAAK